MSRSDHFKQRKFSPEEREKIAGRLQRRRELDKRRRRLYNRRYRKSFIYISTWILRLAYISLFFLAFLFNYRSAGSKKEKVISRTIEKYNNRSIHGAQEINILYFETDRGSYQFNIGNIGLPKFKEGDTLLIERNIFGKPIYFTKEDWGKKYELQVNLLMYYLVLFLTFLSLFFNDGLDRFTDKILWLAWTLDIFAITAYFLS
ncbi:MAG: hypothetical protein ACJ76F_00655 [Bacteroidia bacterium]